MKIRKDTGIPILVIESVKSTSDKDEDVKYSVRGLAARGFTRQFTLSNDLAVNDVELKDGILTVRLASERSKEAEVQLLIK